MKLYFERFDGMAVTTEDFVKAMADASGVNLDKFSRWYNQAGTPSLELKMTESADKVKFDYIQTLTETPETKVKKSQVLPIRIAFFSKDGEQLEVEYNGERAREHTVLVDEFNGQFEFSGVSKGALPSLLRDFSAPIKLKFDYKESDLESLLAMETDPFNLYEAFQKLVISNIHKKIENKDHKLSDGLISAVSSLLDSKHDDELKSVSLNMPSVEYLATLSEKIELDSLYDAFCWFKKELTTKLESKFKQVYDSLSFDSEFKLDGLSRGKKEL